MVIKVISSLIALFLLIACNQKANLDGLWKLDVDLQGQQLPVLMHIRQDKDELSATVFNSDEKIELKGGLKENSFVLEFKTGYARFVGKLVDGSLEGQWIRTNKDNFQVKFTAQKTTMTSLFKSYASKSNLIDLKGNWKVDLGENNFGLGVFSQDGARVQGSILTETGDYRYLDGYIEGNEIKLYGFDGVFSFVLKLIYNNNELKGELYSGNSHHQEITAIRDNSFELTSATKMTQLTAKSPLKFSHVDIQGIPVDLASGDFLGKAKVIQLFGSWCPNCIDETMFFIDWRKNNTAKLNEVKFVAVAFERTKSQQEALKNLKKLQYKLELDYPMVLADFDKTKKVTDFFPIDKMRAFPTTLFLNRNNEIVKVHTGFSGQATGEYFTQFQQEFNQTIDDLIK